MDEDQKHSGCKDIRQAFLAHFHELTHPEAMLAKRIAELQLELDMRTMMDNKDQEGLSKDRFRLYQLIKDFTKLMLEYKDVKAKYTIGTKSEKTVVHKFDDNEIFNLDKRNEKKGEINDEAE